MTPRQLSLDLPVRTALGREDFFVSPANRTALAALDGWRDWPEGKLALVGPEGAGKTHLAHVWAAETGAVACAMAALPKADIPALASAPAIVVEDAPRGGAEAETALFHLHNEARARGAALLVTARTPPATWQLGLPDLASRMATLPVARIEAPDDALLTAVLVKLFADRQIAPPPAVLGYLVSRMPRSLAMAGALVEALDRASLEQGRKVSRLLAAEILDKLAPGAR